VSLQFSDKKTAFDRTVTSKWSDFKLSGAWLCFSNI